MTPMTSTVVVVMVMATTSRMAAGDVGGVGVGVTLGAPTVCVVAHSPHHDSGDTWMPTGPRLQTSTMLSVPTVQCEYLQVLHDSGMSVAFLWLWCPSPHPADPDKSVGGVGLQPARREGCRLHIWYQIRSPAMGVSLLAAVPGLMLASYSLGGLCPRCDASPVAVCVNVRVSPSDSGLPASSTAFLMANFLAPLLMGRVM